MESAAVPVSSPSLEVKVPPSLQPGPAPSDGVATVTGPALLPTVLQCPPLDGHFGTNSEDCCVPQECVLSQITAVCVVCAMQQCCLVLFILLVIKYHSIYVLQNIQGVVVVT